MYLQAGIPKHLKDAFCAIREVVMGLQLNDIESKRCATCTAPESLTYY